MKREKPAPGEVRKLMHELQVHQAELEMQNDELRRVQTDLETSRSNYYELYHFAPVPFLTLSGEGLILEANMAAAALLEKERRSLKSCSFYTFLESSSQVAFSECLREAVKTGIAQSGDFELGPSPSVSSIRRVKIYYDAGPGEKPQVRLAVVDVTALWRSQEELKKVNQDLEVRVRDRTAQADANTLKLRDLALAVSLSAAAERKRLAQLLHDQVQQLMVAAKICADRILKISSTGPSPRKKTADLARDLRQLINDTIEACRSLAIELYPPVLKEAGLWAALEWLGRWMEQKYGLALVFKRRWYFGGGNDTDIFLFEAARECLLNAVKHAETKEPVEVELEYDGGGATLVIRDQGKGFDSSTLRPGNGGHFGLFNLRERARLLGGKMEIESRAGKGARIRVTVPYLEPVPQSRPENPAAPRVRDRDGAVLPDPCFGRR
jgi:signal transduction histidine kinase